MTVILQTTFSNLFSQVKTRIFIQISLKKNSQLPINSLAPGKFEWNFRYSILQIISVIDSWAISCELALRWMSLDLTDDKSTLVQVMAWCRQATSHYLSQCWPRSLSPYGVTWPQWASIGSDNGLVLKRVAQCQPIISIIWKWHHTIWKCLWNGSHFVLVSMCSLISISLLTQTGHIQQPPNLANTSLKKVILNQ